MHLPLSDGKASMPRSRNIGLIMCALFSEVSVTVSFDSMNDEYLRQNNMTSRLIVRLGIEVRYHEP